MLFSTATIALGSMIGAGSVQGVGVLSKAKEVAELKFSGRIQGQYDYLDSDADTADARSHFYFRRLFLGGHAKIGENIGADLVLDFAASTNSGGEAFIEGASVHYKFSDLLRVDIGQLKVPFGLEETTSSSKTPAIERSAINRQFAEYLKFNARHTGLFAKGKLGGGLSYSAAFVNAGQNHHSKSGSLNDGAYGYESDAQAFYGQLRYDGKYGENDIFGGIAYGTQPNTTGNTSAYNLFGGFSYNAFDVVGEYMDAEVDAGDHEYTGYAISPVYNIEYADGSGWQFVYRYSEAWASGGGAISAKEIVRRAPYANGTYANGSIDQHYLGINYLFKGHAAQLMAGYEVNEFEGDGAAKETIDGLRGRFQFLF
jgi:phosphate-selective porin OprO/OprP